MAMAVTLQLSIETYTFQVTTLLDCSLAIGQLNRIPAGCLVTVIHCEVPGSP